VIYVLTRAVCLALFKVLWRPVVVGRENIPPDGWAWGVTTPPPTAR
jgi:hypothetical protein